MVRCGSCGALLCWALGCKPGVFVEHCCGGVALFAPVCLTIAMACITVCCAMALNFYCACHLVVAQHGMSIGIGDTVADLATGAKIAGIIDKAKDDVKRIIEDYQVQFVGCAMHPSTPQ